MTWHAAMVIFSTACIGLGIEALAQAPKPSAAERMSAPGAEQRWLERSVGTWNVTFTAWPSSDATPIVTNGLVAERTMVGALLHEVMRPAPGSSGGDFRRIDYLDYDRIEGRWKYASIDTRLPVSIMPAWSFDKGEPDKIRLPFEPLGFIGFGPEIDGRLTRSDMVITRVSADRELKRQHFIRADGTGAAWLAVQYEYTRSR